MKVLPVERSIVSAGPLKVKATAGPHKLAPAGPVRPIGPCGPTSPSTDKKSQSGLPPGKFSGSSNGKAVAVVISVLHT